MLRFSGATSTHILLAKSVWTSVIWGPQEPTFEICGESLLIAPLKLLHRRRSACGYARAYPDPSQPQPSDLAAHFQIDTDVLILRVGKDVGTDHPALPCHLRAPGPCTTTFDSRRSGRETALLIRWRTIFPSRIEIDDEQRAQVSEPLGVVGCQTDLHGASTEAKASAKGGGNQKTAMHESSFGYFLCRETRFRSQIMYLLYCTSGS
jgi:hypothetical protein